MPRALRSLALTATAVTWVPPLVFGWRWRDYSAPRDFISELGAVDAPDAAAVNVAFAVAGLLVVTLCIALARRLPALRLAMTLMSAVGWSYLVAASVPCDAGCPAEGSGRQAMHNAVGALGYLLGGVGLFVAARPLLARGQTALAWLARAAGVTALAGLMAMGTPELGDVRGASQRIVELGVFVWLLAAAWSRSATSGSSDRRPTSGPA